MDIKDTLATLKCLLQDTKKLAQLSEDDRIELLRLAGQLSRPDKIEQIRRNKVAKKALQKKLAEKELLARSTTGIRRARESKVFTAPAMIESPQPSSAETTLQNPRNCYVCKTEFVKLHHFYDSMCPSCAQFNYQKRFQSADLAGQVALITGARLKIGYQAALMMLRAGASVIVSTRFPVDAALRYAQEKDFRDWGGRLQIYGLDLRHTPSVEVFVRYLTQKLERLDILINNAAQTVRRPPGFYAHLMPNERTPLEQLPRQARAILTDFEVCRRALLDLNPQPTDFQKTALKVNWSGDMGPAVGLRASAELSTVPYSYDKTIVASDVFPEGQLDADLQQVDLRTTNSWRLRLAEVPAPEMLEVQLVNAVAPFVLCSQLAPLMRRDFTGKKHIVNVTAMEGKFYRFKKEDRHPHTNMAKAALNMLTHTSASDLAKDGIFMNAVDTGWVTDEDPAHLADLKKDVHDFQPPLDIVDGAARVCDPFFDGINSGQHWCGKFLKDYFPIDW